MTEFQVDLNHLRSATSAWRDASGALGQAAGQAQGLHDSHKDVTWSVFQDIWNAQVAAAQFMHDIMIEAQSETSSIGSVLLHVADVYLEQDQRFANTLVELDGG